MAYIGRSVNYGNAVTQQLTGNNGASYVLLYDTTTDSVVISLDGVVQVNGTDFNITGTALVFTSTVATGIQINVIYTGLTIAVGVPADNTITNAKLANNAVDSAELVAGSVDLAHLSATGTPSASLALKGDYSWGTAGGPSLGTNAIIRTNGKTIAENITFAGTENGMTAGPITINSGYTVTVTSGSTWTIV
mgnify:FL=1